MITKFKSLNTLLENYHIFKSDTTIPSRLVGYSDIELLKFLEQYKFELPKLLIELLKIGGHNFFQFYFEWGADFKLHTNSINILKQKKYLLNKNGFDYKNLMLISTFEDGSKVFLDFKNEKAPIYTIEQKKISLICNSLEELINDIIEFQKKAYLEYQIRKKQNKLNFIQGKDPIYIEEAERQLMNFEIGQNWTDCLKEAERKYDEYLANENNIFVPKNTVNIQNIDDDLPF